MKTYIADIIPRIQKYSERLDNITLLTNHHWVVMDDVTQSKTVYIFRSNGELLISLDGKVDKAKWEYLGHNSLLIDHKEDSYLFKHGFFDENILALKIDSKEEYALLVNETKYKTELNTYKQVIDFLSNTYLENEFRGKIDKLIPMATQELYKIKQGELIIKCEYYESGKEIIKAILNGQVAPDGKYKLGFAFYVQIKGGIVVSKTLL